VHIHDYCGFLEAKQPWEKAVVCSIEHGNVVSKNILNSCKEFILKKIDQGQQLIQGSTHGHVELRYVA